ncbi:uncharacterized protein LOC129613056 [Condylostylus longicornis]|uniref:uncharacterized protein LOC129613056 n=1 Tax=Condylostylus longicornis TaxID=2530218 RepID=UPI00244E09BA|nr:uncharacterized protein LOC129613056 [Condylostylus longicornis]XP_055382942.1 uncharacterized protein LOC129613056 [Condylostylus longicornis]XP_055382943.1 uncharacterized protein LOC129613056 [Condylostylus longicornis]
MLKTIMQFSEKHKIIRGMISYALLWPCGSLIEQTFVEKKNFSNYDWSKCIKFSLFGGFFMGPTIYIWIRLAGIMWPRTDIKSSISKALTEQLSYDPFMIASFLYGMSRMEGKDHKRAAEEIRNKFFDTYKIGVIYWPIVQTFNFTFIPPKNQVVFTSTFSMFWTSFLAYIKSVNIHHPVDLEVHLIDDIVHFLELV